MVGVVYHTHDSRLSEAGYPDLFMVRDAWTASCWELKVGKNTTTLAQREWMEAIALTGFEVALCRPDAAPKDERWGGFVLTSEGADFGDIGRRLQR